MLGSFRAPRSAMQRLQRVKRRILREVVQENLATVRGLPPRVLRRSRRIPRTLLKTFLLVVVPSGVFLALNALVPRGAVTPPALRPTPAAAAAADRKSTRLNSSHLVISYAVFCLKKKKKHAALRPQPSSIC